MDIDIYAQNWFPIVCIYNSTKTSFVHVVDLHFLRNISCSRGNYLSFLLFKKWDGSIICVCLPANKTKKKPVSLKPFDLTVLQHGT